MLDILKKRKELLSRTIDRLDEKIDSLPEGSIRVKHKAGTFHYLYYQGDKTIKYLRKNDSETIKNLIQKKYLKLVQKAAKQEVKALSKAIELYPKTRMERVYEELPSELKEHALPIIPDDDQFAAKWQAEPFKPKPFRKDAPKLYTLKGERVRSKSEVIIADRLSILRMSDRKVVYYEHCGKMTDPEYTKDIPERANKYARIGIFQGDRLFYTFESAECPLDIEALNTFIESNFC